MAHAGGADATGFAVLHALHWVVLRVAERAPTVLLVDDAHWADEPSLRLLTYLVGRISDEPIAIVLAARAGEPGAGGLLVPLGADPALRVLSPSPLGPAAVATLVRRGGRDADDAFCLRCFELTGGNPLQVRELLAALADQGGRADAGALAAATETAARSLGRSVLRRLGTLTADAQSLAFAVAVLEDAPVALAAALSDGLRRRRGSRQGRARRGGPPPRTRTRSGSRTRSCAPPSMPGCRLASAAGCTGAPRCSWARRAVRRSA